MKWILVLSLLTTAAIFGACSSDDGGGGGGGTTNMATLAGNTMPEFQGSKKSGYTPSWNESSLQGNVAFNIYRLFADPEADPATTPGTGWGVENIRNNLEKAEKIAGTLPTASTGANTVNIEGNDYSFNVNAPETVNSTITCPVSGACWSNYPSSLTWQNGRTVDLPTGMTGSLEGVYATVAPRLYLMTATYFDNSGEYEYGLMYGDYDDSSADADALNLNVSMHNPEGPNPTSATDHFSFRMDLTGNPTTKAFSIYVVKHSYDSTSGGGFHLSMYAKGSAASGGHFIVKTQKCDNSGSYGGTCLSGASAVYYCIKAETPQAQFEDFINNGDNSYILSGSDPTAFTGFCASSTYATDVQNASLHSESAIPSSYSSYTMDLY
jgi:hypothetical protein